MNCERVVIINDFSVARGGATALALLAAELFREQDIPVTLFAGDNAENPELDKLGIDVVSVGSKPLLEQSTLRAMTTGLYNSQAKAALQTLIQTRDTPGTIYHVHAWSLILSPSIFSALRPVASRVFIHSHDQFLACPNGAFFDFQKGKNCSLTPLGMTCLTTHCDKRSYVHKGWRVSRQAVLAKMLNDKTPWGGIILIHPKMEPRLKRFGYANSKMVTVRNPVDPFAQARVTAEQNDTFFFVGRVEPDKGILELARAATAAEVPLSVIGDGPLCDVLRAEFPDIEQLGWCDKPTMGRHMQKARALVMPSRFAEPFGLVAVEALQSGIPVIVGHDAFLADEITENGLGFACNIHDVDAFRDMLLHVKTLGADEMKRMSELGFSNTHPLALQPQEWCDALLALFDTALVPETA